MIQNQSYEIRQIYKDTYAILRQYRTKKVPDTAKCDIINLWINR